MLIQRILVTLIPVALLAGCVSAPAPGDRLNALFEAAGGPAAPPAEPLPQRAQAMYHVLAGQVAGDRGDLALAAEEYLEAARLTGQADIAKEATRYALASNNRALSVQASQLWRTAAPDNVQAQEAAFRVAVRARSYDTALDMAKAYVAAEPERRGEALRAVAATLVTSVALPGSLTLMLRGVPVTPETTVGVFDITAATTPPPAAPPMRAPTARAAMRGAPERLGAGC